MKTLPFRVYAQILIFSGLVALGALILWPLQQALYGGMLSIRDDLINRLESQIGRKIRYSSISPSLFGSFDVRNVRIIDRDDLPVLTVSRFRVAYSLADLLRGRTRAIRSVQIDAPNIDFNSARDHDLIAVFENMGMGQGGGEQSLGEMLPDRLLVRIRNGKCSVFDGDDRFNLEEMNFSAEIADGNIVLDGKWNAGFSISKPIGDPMRLDLAMRLTGSCRTGLEEGEAVFSVPTITGDALSSAPLAFALELQNGIVNARKMQDGLPFELTASYNMDAGRLDAQFGCDGFLLRDFVNFSGGLEGFNPLLDVVNSGSAFFTHVRDGTLVYSVNMKGAAVTSPAAVQGQAGFSPVRAAGASFEIDAVGDEKGAEVKTLRISMPVAENGGGFFMGNINYTGQVGLQPFSPEGALILNDFSLTGENGISADIAIHTHNGEISAFCDTMVLGPAGRSMELTAFSALVQSSGSDTGFSASALRFMDIESYDNVRMGSVSLEGSMNSAARRVEASLRLDSFSAGDLVFVARSFVDDLLVPGPAEAVLQGVSITTEVFLTVDSGHVLYNVFCFIFAGSTAGGLMGLVSIAGTDRQFTLGEGRLVLGEEALLVSGRADFPTTSNAEFSINANYRDLDYQIHGALLDGKSVSVEGSYGLVVTLNSRDGRSYTGSLDAANFPLPFLGRPALLTAAARLGYENASKWSMELERFEITGITGPAGQTQIQLSGSADQNGANLPSLYYQDTRGPLNGSAHFSWSKGRSGVYGNITMQETEEQYRAEGSLEGNSFSLLVSGVSMQLDRFFGKLGSAVADGDIRLNWDSAESFSGEINLSSLNGNLYENDFSASAHAVIDNTKCSVNNLTIRFAGLEGTAPLFTINCSDGTVQAQAELKGAAGGKPLESALSLEANFIPVRSWLEFDKALNNCAGSLHVEGLNYGATDNPQTFDVAFSRSAGSLSVSGGPRNMLRLQMDSNGNFFAGLSSPFPVRGSVAGSIKNNMIDANCSDLYVDMGGLFALLPDSPDIYLTGGYVNGSIDVKGTLTDPEFFGTVRGTSLRFRIPHYMPQELRPIPFNAKIEGNEITFGPVFTSVGRGAGTVAGWFRFDRWIPNIFSIDIAVPRETAIPYGFDISGFIASGDVSGSLNVAMENLTLDISGDLYANNSELGINTDEITGSSRQNAVDNPAHPVLVDMTITTGPVVEFLYPNSRLPILRANPDIGTKIKVTADSLAQQFSVVSDVKIRGGEIFYFERSFYIRSGTLVFKENELRFDPRLTARAEVHDRTEEGPVTISMIVDNAPLLSFNARFESAPSLSQMEIFSLLGQNLVGAQPETEVDSSARMRAFLTSGSDFLAQLVLIRRLEQVFRNFTRLDMFTFRTRILQNALFMLTDSTVDRMPGVGNYFDNTTLSGGKYIGQDLFAQGMFSMRYDPNKTTLGGLVFELDIGVELQSPLFNIRWNFVPAHPENWYFNDNSITVMRSLSF